MPKGIYQRTEKAKNAGRHKKPNKLVNDTIKLPMEVKRGLTTKEKRTVLVDAHFEKMRDLEAWCDRMLNKLNSK